MRKRALKISRKTSKARRNLGKRAAVTVSLKTRKLRSRGKTEGDLESPSVIEFTILSYIIIS